MRSTDNCSDQVKPKGFNDLVREDDNHLSVA